MAEDNKNIESQPAVDETPISPSRPNQRRKNSLEEHLKNRPERAELVDRKCISFA